MSTEEQAKWEQATIAYLRNLTDACRNCLKTYNCPNCIVTTAKTLLKRKEEIGLHHRFLIDKKKDPYSLKARYREIINTLRKAGKPLRARDIRLVSTTSRNLKWWTLKRMNAKGLIRKCRVKNIYGKWESAYYLPPKTSTKGK